MFTLWKAPAALVLSAVLALSSTACTTLRGAPDPLVKPKQLEANGGFAADTLVKNLIESGDDQSARDTNIVKLLAVCDIRYAQFRNELVSNRRHTKATAGALSLLTNVAASLTDSVGVKDNYIALSTLIQGGQTIYDRDYLLDRTLDALVAQMDANRTSQLVTIREGMQLSPRRYPAQAALSDVLNYYHAGTLNGAIIGVQKSASEQQIKSTETLRTITDKSTAQIKAYRDQTTWENAFVDKLPDSAIPVLYGYIAAQSPVDPLPADIAGQRLQVKYELGELREEKFETDPKPMNDALIAKFGITP
ncbi:hypothetical protein [Pseudomonas sp. CGJS7]|uniref:hypothetical protein n=1 Tax=Pseudomonas sp. CGJS7 TaxID=3109348 RepID=UPI003009413F